MINSLGKDKNASARTVNWDKTGRFLVASLQAMRERVVFSVHSWIERQCVQNKQAIDKLCGRIKGHWRGELSLFQVYFYCPALGCVVLVVLFVAVITTEAVLNLTAVRQALLEATSLAVMGTFGLWWCIGTFRKTNKLLSENRLTIAALVYASACWSSWQFGFFFFPAMHDSIGNFSNRIDEQRESFAELQESQKRQPWRVTAQPELRRIIAEGDIGFGSADALALVVRQYPQLRLIELNSRGGYVAEMNKLVAIVESNHLDTFVREKCASACTDVFLAGEHRYIDPDARFGFHQSGYKGRPRDTEWSITEYMTSIDYRAKGLPEPFISKALNTSYYELWRPDALALKSSGFATAWWSDRGPEYR